MARDQGILAGGKSVQSLGADRIGVLEMADSSTELQRAMQQLGNQAVLARKAGWVGNGPAVHAPLLHCCTLAVSCIYVCIYLKGKREGERGRYLPSVSSHCKYLK